MSTEPIQTPAPTPTPLVPLAAPVCPKCGKAGTIFAIVFLILFFVASAGVVWFYLEGVEALNDVSRLSTKITGLDADIDMLESERDKLVKALNDIAVAAEEDQFYRDTRLEFYYPGNIRLNSASIDGMLYRRFFFLETNEDGVLRSSGYELTYPRQISEMGIAATNFDELINHYTGELIEMAEVTQGEINGRRYVLVESDVATGEQITYYIETDIPCEVVQINGAFRTPTSDQVIDMLLDTLQIL